MTEASPASRSADASGAKSAAVEVVTQAAHRVSQFVEAVLGGHFEHGPPEQAGNGTEMVNVAHVGRFPPEVLHLLGGEAVGAHEVTEASVHMDCSCIMVLSVPHEPVQHDSDFLLG